MHVDLVKCWTKFDYGEFNLLYILSPTGETSLKWFGHGGINFKFNDRTQILNKYYSSCLILMSGVLFYFAICTEL